MLALASAMPAMASGPGGPSPGRPDRGYGYVHDTVPAVPWSIHVFRVSRARRDLAFTTTLGRGDRLGMGTVSEQMRRFPAELGTPLAAVNGDFYVSEPEPLGDPRDLQIRDGELVSAPTGHAVLWLDASGAPRSTNVVSRFRVVWPDGTSTPFGLNELREPGAAVLYSAAVGAKAWSEDGTDLILERHGTNTWLPLRAGTEFTARVREARTGGGAPVQPDTLVLSLGPRLGDALKQAVPGAVLRLVTETVPDLSGVTTAIGGGPTLVRNGRPMEWSGFLLRHPRTAIGWNDEQIFLVEVDGRQGDLSVGMTFPELAEYLVKLGCREAINLDGGGSATMWALGQIVNSPSEGQERAGANSLVVYLRRPQPAETDRTP
ncbi:MAG: phosphodiester glycosidase family protein [Verrucomicrobia bacterium]|nr:phosphodiester glycosidase family protein [Verrucomicrobiota bacterium]